jgi:hypothetical protein
MTYPQGQPQQPQGPPFPAQAQQGQAHPGTQQFHPMAPKRPSPLARFGVEKLLPLAVLVLALVSYFVSFGAGGASVEVYLLLAGGLLAAMSVAPKAEAGVLGVGAVLSVLGGLGMLAAIVRTGSGAVTAILILVFGVLQLLVALAAYLISVGLLTLPPANSPAPPQQPGWGPYPGGQPQGGQPYANQQTVMTQQPPMPQQPPPHQGQSGSVDLFGGQR